MSSENRWMTPYALERLVPPLKACRIPAGTAATACFSTQQTQMSFSRTSARRPVR